jgi:hypothetical protein
MTPPDVNPNLWSRYLRGTRAYDDLYSSGQRCPENPAGARCMCLIPRKEICRYWVGVVALAEEIGGATAEIVKGIR